MAMNTNGNIEPQRPFHGDFISPFASPRQGLCFSRAVGIFSNLALASVAI
jgi:hypothetical protein